MRDEAALMCAEPGLWKGHTVAGIFSPTRFSLVLQARAHNCWLMITHSDESLGTYIISLSDLSGKI